MILSSSLKSQDGGQSLIMVALITVVALGAATALMMVNKGQLDLMVEFRQKTEANSQIRRIQVTMADPALCSASFSGLNSTGELAPSGPRQNLYNTLFADQENMIKSITLIDVKDVTGMSPDLKIGTLSVTLTVEGAQSKPKRGLIPMYFRVDPNNTIYNCQTTQFSGIDNQTIETAICDGLVGGNNAFGVTFDSVDQCLKGLLIRIGNPTQPIVTAGN